jgi:hypothetical protein
MRFYTKPVLLIAIASIALETSDSAQAHHSAAPHFDLQKSISVEGVVTKFAFVNPHSYVFFDVQGAGGKQEHWRCELAARTALEQLGWTAKTFAPGRKIVFKGAPARREANVCYLTSYIGPDGAEVRTREDSGGPAKALNPSSAPRTPPPLDVASHLIPLQHDAAGHPKIAGYWVARLRDPAKRGAAPPLPKASDAGIKAAKSYDQRFDDPAIKCSPANIIFGWTHDRNVNDIVQTGTTITLKYGYMDFVRTIHLDASTHPTNIKPSLGGHSIGHWEGDVLVVDTVGFAPGVLIPLAGVLHSGKMHIVERFELNADAGTIARTYTVEDPLYLAAPYTGTDVMVASDKPFERYDCVELSGKNNQRPAGQAK